MWINRESGGEQCDGSLKPQKCENDRSARGQSESYTVLLQYFALRQNGVKSYVSNVVVADGCTVKALLSAAERNSIG